MRQDFEILKLLKTIWLIIGTNKPPSLSNITCASKIKNILTFYCSTHENILLMDGFKSQHSELIEDDKLSTLILETTCFKSINPTCIDNFLSSKKTCFMNTLTFKTSVSDHHKLVGTTPGSTCTKGKP